MSDLFARRVKIVCTLGPSSNSPESISNLAKAGMDVARLNFSHGTHATHKKLFQIVREVSRSLDRNISIMQDLQGPKIRLGTISAPGILLEKQDQVLLYPEDSSPKQKAKKKLPLLKGLAEVISKDIQAGARVLLDDGKVMTRVLKVLENEILVETEVGGLLTSNKGLNLPGTPLSIPSLTEKDLQDLEFGLSIGVDAVALSFVRSPEDIEQVRAIIERSAHRPWIIAKMEREEAIDRYEEIVDVSDALLIARGDMAVELGVEGVPIIQKRLIRACNSLGVPVITATQMLESMVASPMPTRAEANDVANAVFDGTDAVMLSGETASGQFPVRAVETMSQVVQTAEGYDHDFSNRTSVLPLPGSIVDSIEYSAAKMAQHVNAKVIVCISQSGRAVQTLAKYRPEIPIVAMVDRDEIFRKMPFVWGVQGLLIPTILKTDDLFAMIEAELKKAGLAQNGDYIVITAGIPSLRRGTTNMVKVHQLGASIEQGSSHLTISNDA